MIKDDIFEEKKNTIKPGFIVVRFIVFLGVFRNTARHFHDNEHFKCVQFPSSRVRLLFETFSQLFVLRGKEIYNKLGNNDSTRTRNWPVRDFI